MSKVVHAYRYFSSTMLLFCRKNRPAYKQYNIAKNAVHFGDQSDVTCKKCLSKMGRE